METSCNIKSTITYGIDPDTSVQDSRPLRAGNCKMAMLPLYVHFLLKLQRIFSCVCHILNNFK